MMTTIRRLVIVMTAGLGLAGGVTVGTAHAASAASCTVSSSSTHRVTSSGTQTWETRYSRTCGSVKTEAAHEYEVTASGEKVWTYRSETLRSHKIATEYEARTAHYVSGKVVVTHMWRNGCSKVTHRQTWKRGSYSSTWTYRSAC